MRKKALVVGINDYPSSPLTACVRDATSFRNVLKAHGTAHRDLKGPPNFDVKLVTSPPETINKSNLKGAIETLFSGSPDIALFYFSGHGVITSTGGYIVTPDFKRYDEGVSMDEILDLANQSTAKEKVIILDCCHSGAIGAPPNVRGRVAPLSEGLTILTASQGLESAMEINGRSVFTALVVDALQGGAADLRGYITLGSIYAYVDQALGPHEQRPIFKTNITGFTSIRNVPPLLPYGTLQKICDYFESPQHEHALDPSYEFTDPRANPEKVDIFKDLQKFTSSGLVVPVGEDHMYFAAMNSKSCRLTALGHQYWRLVKEEKMFDFI
ncbi:MAG: caspase family protein [Nitrospira sp.]|nr:caspase family protein [Nitrospira sp.]